ncbi:aldo/keto reductase [Armatimonas rosea]|uniref:Aryl-alcohol dehydrogenase-like predicted oxidoreductase n=1 Tax=Armatimonas rosea TaxID=685828 RepID=A0A7W9SWE5_ARMRO|nr:aldo/keto reductase [Armatimonas rosea]MBB6053605.1 aryl-alcohol dehydrogenase-like predicted oxidoreductase [Armatimonas rosea]
MIKTVSLGRSGLKVSNLCLGCMNFGESTSEEDSLTILRTAVEAGVTFWDTADVYGAGRSEEILGKAFQAYGVREQVVLATKVNGAMGPGANDKGLSRCHLRLGVEASLRRLQTDWIDLYQLHRYDPTVPLDETIETLDTLVKEGKIRYWGTSTFASWQLAEAQWRADFHHRIAPVCEQAPYNILDRRLENDRAGYLQHAGWGLIVWSPLAGGQLTGKYGAISPTTLPTGSRIARNAMWRQRTNRSASEVAMAFVELAREHGHDPAVAAVAWTLVNPLVTAPIVGPRTLEQLTSLLPAASLALDETFLSAVDALVPPGTAVADFLNNAGWQVGRLPGLDNDRTGTA